MSKHLKIVVTGGPSGGKTTLIDALQKEFKNRLAVVPEAASILYRGGFPRRATEKAREHAQRAICFTQRELENLAADETSTSYIICDRGSLDSVAYWPSGSESFFASLGTDKDAELARYQWVIHLDTAAQDYFDSSNPIRTESHLQALELNARIKEAWSGHPQRVIIAHEDDFIRKMMRAKNTIEQIMDGHLHGDVVKALQLPL